MKSVQLIIEHVKNGMVITEIGLEQPEGVEQPVQRHSVYVSLSESQTYVLLKELLPRLVDKNELLGGES